MTDYSDAPKSLAIARAEKEADASIVNPRDVLVELLRDIDSGADIDLAVICYRFAGSTPGRGRASYMQAGGCGLHDSLGIMERVKHMMNRDADET